MNRKITSLLLALSAAVSLLAGCGQKSEPPEPYEGKSQPEVVYSAPAVTESSKPGGQSEASASPSADVPVKPSYEPEIIQKTEPDVPKTTPDPTAVVTENGLTAASALGTTREKFLDTTSEEFVAYTTGNKEFESSDYHAPYLFDFRSYMAVGYSLNDTKNQLAVEADYGVWGKFNGTFITIRSYDHTDKNITVTEAYVEALDKSVNMKEKLPPLDQGLKGDFTNDPNGLYRVSARFSNDTTAQLYFIINGDEYLFCQMIMTSKSVLDSNHNIDMIRKRRAVLQQLLNEYPAVTPENSLDVDIIKYPHRDEYYNGKQIWRCDTMKWAELSDSLVDSSWSNERKAYVICDWMSQNLAYDRYVSDVLNHDRENEAHIYTGEYSVWNFRSGVCRDFGQILAIMLRRQGIPCEVISNETHLWNIVYLNGRWIEVDICESHTKFVMGADTTVRVDSRNNYYGLLSMAGQTNNTNYGTSLHKLLYMDQASFD